MKKKLFWTLIIISIFFIIQGFSNIKKPISKNNVGLLGTNTTITLYDYKNKSVLDKCFDLIKEYQDLFSQNIEGSEISLINNAKGNPVEVSDETIFILEKSIYYSTISNGLFDITVGTVSKLWNFTEEEPTVPDEKMIKEALKHVNYKNIKIEGNTVTLLDAETQLDLGAIAKGYIADKLKEQLQDNGVSSAIIDLGGNIIAFGSKPISSRERVPFKIGIRDPEETRNEIIGFANVTDSTIVTSGIYERSFYYDDVFYHHILDPTTGMPFNSDLAGITIIADKSVDADSLSTVTFLLGEDEGRRLIENIDGVDAIFVKLNGDISYTSNTVPLYGFKITKE
jgi:FAD:protein FMN transferase